MKAQNIKNADIKTRRDDVHTVSTKGYYNKWSEILQPFLTGSQLVKMLTQVRSPRRELAQIIAKKKYNKQVTAENATRLFKLSEQLCNIRYE